MASLIDTSLDPFIQLVTNAKARGDDLITAEELAKLRQRIVNRDIKVWRESDELSFSVLAREVEKKNLLPEEKAAIKSALVALTPVALENVSNGTRAQLERADDKLPRPFALALAPLVVAARGTEPYAGEIAAISEAASTAWSYVRDLFTSTSDAVTQATQSRDPKQEAKLIHFLIAPYTGGVETPAVRLAHLSTLLAGVDAPHMAEIRSAYIDSYGSDPVHHALGTGLLQSFIRHQTKGQALALEDFLLWRKSESGTEEQIEEVAVQVYQRIIRDPEAEPSAEAVAMFNLLMQPLVRAETNMIHELSSKLERGEALTAADRQRYYAELPMVGIRTRSARPESGRTLEKLALKHDWSTRLGHAHDLDKTMAKLEAAFPSADPPKPNPKQKSVAVLVSSQGAQWQELMGYVMKMRRHGVHVQIFTPDGRPAAFQLDSLMRSSTAALGYGAPEELDVQGPCGIAAKQLLAHALPAERFEASQFDQLYISGGLGLNEDAFIARPTPDATDAEGRQSGPQSSYEASPGVAHMMNTALRKQMPILAVCHGPSAFAAENVDADVSGANMAAPLEPYVAFTGRTGAAFQHMSLVHNDLRRQGAHVHLFRDLLQPRGVAYGRVKTTDDKGQPQSVQIVTGPHPAAARTLGLAGLELLGVPTHERPVRLEDRARARSSSL